MSASQSVSMLVQVPAFKKWPSRDCRNKSDMYYGSYRSDNNKKKVENMTCYSDQLIVFNFFSILLPTSSFKIQVIFAGNNFPLPVCPVQTKSLTVNYFILHSTLHLHNQIYPQNMPCKRSICTLQYRESCQMAICVAI